MNKSSIAFKQAQEVIPGGVNSPVRAFKSVGIDPLFIKKAKGTTLYDIDGNSYTDFVASWGPLIFGHANDTILAALADAAALGTSFGAPTEIETAMAQQIVKMVPTIDKVRMVNSGTEATMSAIRLARAYTGKEVIIKFAGCYHGHGDSFLIKAGSGAITLGLPDSPGVTKNTAKDTLTAEYNNLDSVKQLFQNHPEKIAAVIIEPVAGNMGVIPPVEGFLEGLREMTTAHGALLIFDEVITGFRLAKGGAQEYYNIQPDLTTLGKIIGGGLPVGAYGGRRDIMDMLAPNGPVYQAGTLSGNPLAMAAGLATLKMLDETANAYEELEKKALFVENGFKKNAEELGVDMVVNRVGSMMTAFFTSAPKVSSFDQAMTCNTNQYASYFKEALKQGLYLSPSQFESLFISMAHSQADLEKLIQGNRIALENI